MGSGASRSDGHTRDLDGNALQQHGLVVRDELQAVIPGRNGFTKRMLCSKATERPTAEQLLADHYFNN